MRITLSAQDVVEFSLLITLLALQAQSAAFGVPLPQLLVSFTSLPCFGSLTIAHFLSFLIISPEAPQSPANPPAQSSASHNAKPETAKRSTSAARIWREERNPRASSLEASFSEASSRARSSRFSSSSSGADSSSSGSLPPAQTLPTAEQGTTTHSKAGAAQFLGQGAGGKVYVDGDDAVKVMPCDSRTQLEMAEWEFQCMQCAGEWCPNVVMARDLSLDARPEGIVALLRMERCAGSLVDFLERVPAGSPMEVCEAFALKVLLQATQAVGAVHAMGLVHADVKPANILLKEFPASLGSPLPADAVKLCDFGLAFVEKDGLACPCGTPNYMAPEVEALGVEREEAPAAPTAKMDVFSLGKTFLDAILIPQPYLEGATDLSPATAALIRAMTAEDPKERISPEEVLDRIIRHPLLAY